MYGEIVWAVRHVLTSRARRAYLLEHGLWLPLLRFLICIVPMAKAQLRAVRNRAIEIPDERLRAQAIASIDAKAYHVAGACILATFLPPKQARAYVECVAPLESIYDYLDNLCDRHPEVPVSAYPVLHRAIADALDPQSELHDYYASGPLGNDGGYLRNLVLSVRRSLARLKHYGALRAPFSEAAVLYGEMQTYTHLPAGERERACIQWFGRRRDARTEGLYWYEFASAAGSQFQIYAPLYECFAGRTAAIVPTYHAHFPAVAALHVLFDAYIDQREDREHRELNLAAAYPNSETMVRRTGILAAAARERFSVLPNPTEHLFVLRVMALFYLTHPKVYDQGLQRQAESLLCRI